MSSDLPESDWRRFKEVRTKLLERYCNRIWKEVENLAKSSEGTSYDRYLKLYELVKERDKQMAHAFDDLRRSTAILQLGILRRMNLLTDDELGLFSEQTRTRVEGIASI